MIVVLPALLGPYSTTGPLASSISTLFRDPMFLKLRLITTNYLDINFKVIKFILP